MAPEFRVWDKEYSTYTTNQVYYYVTPEGEVYDSSFGEIDSNVTNTVIVEQYTGLKDKNGNKIYEGDIVHCENDYQGTDYTGKVMFFNGGFCVWTGGFRNYVWDDMIPEIIGNIHENPELLEVEK